MPFIEYHPDTPAFPPAKPPGPLGRLLFILGFPLALLFNLCHPVARIFGFPHTTRVEHAGWLALWTTPHLVCGYCGARIQRLEFANQPLPIPPGWDGPSEREDVFALSTPVGAFTPWKGRWIRAHWEPPRVITQGTFNPEDQHRGWYATEFRDEHGQPASDRPRACHNACKTVLRRTGTPDDWCLVEGPHPRWTAPSHINDVVSQMIQQEEDQQR